jgi:hypothetical protein
MALTKVTSGLTDLDGGITIDNITIDGTEIDLSSGDLTIDVASDIILDADGGDIYFKDDGTEFLRFQQDGGNVNIRQDTSDKDVLFLGNDGGSSIVALTLDMSNAGAATFNSTVTVGAGPTTAGAVGTYALLWRVDSTTANSFGDTLAGSNLRAANTYHSGTYSNFGYGSSSMSGTWRCMGQTGIYNGLTAYSSSIWMGCTVWVRVS